MTTIVCEIDRIVISQNIINKRRLHTSLNMYCCTKHILSDDLKTDKSNGIKKYN